ncbi:hypothetical protein KKE99_03430 [Patescibacteria group bacterium]|nr:hypothetical protein [Patescibacteria group bacterium]
MPIKKIKRFIRKSIYSSPDDIEKSYHKISNLILKTISIFFVIAGLWSHAAALHLYYYTETTMDSESLILVENYQKTRQAYKEESLFEAVKNSISVERFQEMAVNSSKEEMLNKVDTLNLFGIGFTLIGVFLALVLMIRYIAFTLADKIYNRCYADEEERAIKNRGGRKTC